MTTAEAARLAESLELDLDGCPCASRASASSRSQIDGGDEPKIRGAVFRMTPDLWADGLELPAWRRSRAPATGACRVRAEALGELAASGLPEPHRPCDRAASSRQQLADRAAADRLRTQWAPRGRGAPRTRR